MAEVHKILVIEDEQEIRRFLRASLSGHGFDLIESSTGKGGLNLLDQEKPDLILLDLGLPDMDGLSIIRRVRGWSKIPIIVISARGHETDKVHALDGGADDYLTKPFSVPELLARIRVAQRHVADDFQAQPIPVFELHGLRVDLEHRHVTVDGEEVHLTPIEYRILTTLIKYAGKVVTHRQLLNEVWGPQSVLETHYLRVYMTHLRRKIESNPAQPRYLLTESGIGYRLAAF